MILSMTGYGRAEAEFHNKKITVEIKSLNSKQFDINLRIPSVYKDKEVEIRNKLLQIIERGKVDFTIVIDSSDKSPANKINRCIVESYYNEIKEIARTLEIKEPDDWFSVLLRLPETIKTEAIESDEEEWRMICQAIDEASKTFIRFRIQEGEMLEKVFIEKIQNISILSKEIEKYESERIEKIRVRIRESFHKMEIPYDENRFEQEMVYYVDRLDISEEKARLSNHLSYFSETMTTEKSQGRKLGFIVQEIGREINTLGSKSNHAGMQKIVVQMKDELEQVKEQILNVL
ncbi:MAG: YicC family protein [Candidatus Azobacteroides sp.]|nr:YicC family protein [Candidatus Azobacteroides sp.]